MDGPVRNYDLLEPTDDVDESLKRLMETFGPLYTDSWVAGKSHFYGDPQYKPNIASLMAMWVGKTLKLFIGYRDMRPAGYIVGLVFRPFTHERTVLQVEDWFAPDDDELMSGMFDYMQKATRFMGIDEIWAQCPEGSPAPQLGPAWKEVRATRNAHFVKR